MNECTHARRPISGPSPFFSLLHSRLDEEQKLPLLNFTCGKQHIRNHM